MATRAKLPCALTLKLSNILNMYERKRIASWLQQHDVSPLTNRPLAHKMRTPNLLARTLSDIWRERHGLPVPPPPVFDHGEKVAAGVGAVCKIERDAAVLAAFARANLKTKFEMLDDASAHLKSEFVAILQRGDVCLNQFTVDVLACSTGKTHELSLTIVEFAAHGRRLQRWTPAARVHSACVAAAAARTERSHRQGR
jgi:hypothetical protein